MLSKSLNYSFELEGTALKFVLLYKKQPLSMARNILGLALLTFVMSSFAVQFFVATNGAPDDFPSVIFPPPFFAVAPILIIWMAGFLFEGFDLLWQLVGREVVKIEDNRISIRHEVLGLGFTRTIPFAKIDAVFLSRYKSASLLYTLFHRGLWFFNFEHGRIGVNSGKTWFGRINTVRFGSILDDSEAREIIAVIHKRFPQYKHPSKLK
jgi:hypothetical protein